MDERPGTTTSVHSAVERTAFQAQAMKKQSSPTSSSSTSSSLVQLGYQIRTRLIAQCLERVLCDDFDTEISNLAVTLVVLGAGMEDYVKHVLLLQMHAAKNNTDYRVIELDLPAICAQKKELMLQTYQHASLNREKAPAAPIEWQGRLQPKPDTWDSPVEKPTSPNEHPPLPSTQYTLVSCDLQSMDVQEQLRVILDLHVSNNLASRTKFVFISEVCLCYVGTDRAFHILEFCGNWATTTMNADSNNISSTVLIGYEPIGMTRKQEEQMNTTAQGASVLQQYQQEYFERFQARVGNMAPLATTTLELQTQLSSSFDYAHVATAREAARSFQMDPLLLSDFQDGKVAFIFDEHIALALHLESYALFCAFRGTNLLERRRLCPWTLQFPPRIHGPQQLWIAEMESIDNDGVKEGFLETYRGYFDDHPTLLKMHKAVQRKDFRGDIQSWYRQEEGIYLIAFQKENRKVVGGVGVRKVKNMQHDQDEATYADISETYEIQRLWADPACRRRGIATGLMDAVYEFLTEKKDPLNKISMVLTTLSILPAAVSFYTKQGFELKREDTQNGLTYQTFTKTL